MDPGHKHIILSRKTCSTHGECFGDRMEVLCMFLVLYVRPHKNKSVWWEETHQGRTAVLFYFWGFSGGSVVKNPHINARDAGLIPGLGRVLGGGNGNPLQYCCCFSVAKSRLILCNPMDWSIPGFPVLHYLPEFAQTHVQSVMPSNHFILCHSLLLLPSIFPSISIFSNELALHIRWPKYWSFSFCITPSIEYSGLIFFRINWFDLLAVQGTLKSLL